MSLRRPNFASAALVLSIAITSTLAIQEGLKQQEEGGQLLLSRILCGDGICGDGEADTVIPGGCPAGSPPECLGPPSRYRPGTCPSDCKEVGKEPLCGNGICETGEDAVLCPSCAAGTPPEFCKCVMLCEQDCGDDDSSTIDPCVYKECPYGCTNGTCDKPDECAYKDCPYGCTEGRCNPPPPPPDPCTYMDCAYGCSNGTCDAPPERCGDGDCTAEENAVLCPACAAGTPPEFCKCTKNCTQDCGEYDPSSKPTEDPCTYLDCSFGCSNGKCELPPPTPDPCTYMDCEFGCSNGKCTEYGCDENGLCTDPPPEKDLCIIMRCLHGCKNSQCLPPEPPKDLCKNKFCPYGCVNGECLPAPAVSCKPLVCGDGTSHPRCTEDGAPINYLVHPCKPLGKFCYSTLECLAGMTCTVDIGDCMSDPTCPECDVCVGTCIFTEQPTAASDPVPISRPPVIEGPAPLRFEHVLINTRSREKLPTPETNQFSDTSLDDEVGKAANILHDLGVVNGYPDGSFRRNSAVIRAEAAKMLLLARYGDFPKTANSRRFWDVQDGAWYVPYVIGAANLGIINGYVDRSFRPNNTVNTVDFLKMLAITFDLETGLPYYYLDVPPDAWYAQYVGIAERMNLLPNRIENLDPERLLTRGEVAQAIARVLILREE